MTTELEKFSSAYEPAPNLNGWRRTAPPRRPAPGIRAMDLFRACLLLAMAAFMAPVAAAQQPLTVVSNLDPKRYAGEWFEIARFPNRFQDKCVGDVVARYEIRPEGGLVDGEVERLGSIGFESVHLGARILRVEPVIPLLVGRLFD